jgi:hypothetical protein
MVFGSFKQVKEDENLLLLSPQATPEGEFYILVLMDYMY